MIYCLFLYSLFCGGYKYGGEKKYITGRLVEKNLRKKTNKREKGKDNEET
jgi:hypothetical protein